MDFQGPDSILTWHIKCCMTNFERKTFLPLIIIILSIASRSGLSFEIDGSKWIGSKADVYVYFEGKSASGISWNEAFLDAVSEWNLSTPFSINPISKYRNPCIADGLNGVDFVRDLCGTGFGKSTLGVTVRRYKPQVLGPPAIVEADIYLNANVSFDVFNAAGSSLGTSYLQTKDFRRVVLHELGHLIGLDHEEAEEAIMQPEYGEIFNLEQDDIAGVETLYGGLSSCEIQALRLGMSSGSLSSPDCTVKQLTVGGSDDSLIDIYSFTLNSPTEVNFSVISPELEAVIIIADAELNYLANDSAISGNCGADLKVTLPPRDYLLLINTFDRAVRAECGVKGAYNLSVGYIGPDAQELGAAASLRGQSARAMFSGKITADDGHTYGNRFHSKDSIDVTASIRVDPSHVGEKGFLVVAGIIGRESFWLSPEGQFVRTDSIPGQFLSLSSKNLDTSEEIEIMTDFIPSNYGIRELVVEFYVGYGLDTDPGNVFFNSIPINLTIESH